MPTCRHKPLESTRGVGPCDIRSEVKNRNGTERHWCFTHGQPAWRPDGEPMEQCAGAFFDEVSEEGILEVDLQTSRVGIWGALPPAISMGDVLDEDSGGVHVHVRDAGDDEKILDRSFEMVRLRRGDNDLLIEGTAAVAFSISQMLSEPLVVLRCPKQHCGALHLDELQFATGPHRKHQCNRCGRAFVDADGPSISNPLADAHVRLGLPPSPAPVRPDRPIHLRTDEYAGIAVWPSNPAVVWSMPTAEEEGIHVHAWDQHGEVVLDETYSELTLDGVAIQEDALRSLAAMRGLAHSEAETVDLPCANCGQGLQSVPDPRLVTSTTHLCAACGATSRTRRRCFVHPLATFGHSDRRG